MAEYLRVREPGKHALLNPETGLHETPKGDTQFAADHPLVKAHPWAFGTEEEIAAEREAARNVTSVPIEPPVEQATRAPGERRTTRRPRK
jgi:hypothetical protein